MQKLSQLQAPALAGVVKEPTVRSAIAGIKNCLFDGADMIDLHMSCLVEREPESLKKIISASRLPVLALNYNQKHDRSDAGFTEEEREALFYLAVEAGAAGVDMQGYTFCPEAKDAFVGEDIYSFTKGNPKEVVTDPAIITKQCAFIDQVHEMGAEVLLSCHPGIPMNCEQVVELALFLEKRNPDIIKIVTKANNEDDLSEAIRTMTVLKKEMKTPVAFHAAGEAGLASRIINPLLGSQIAFCVERYDAGSAMEQPLLRTVRTVVDNARKITGDR